ncbi:hypothetical protein AAZX31_16G077500 [Glycine max]
MVIKEPWASLPDPLKIYNMEELKKNLSFSSSLIVTPFFSCHTLAMCSFIIWTRTLLLVRKTTLLSCSFSTWKTSSPSSSSTRDKFSIILWFSLLYRVASLLTTNPAPCLKGESKKLSINTFLILQILHVKLIISILLILMIYNYLKCFVEIQTFKKCYECFLEIDNS